MSRLLRRLEIELDDDVVVVVDWVADTLREDAGAVARFLEALEGAEPGVEIGDRMFDVEGGHRSPLLMVDCRDRTDNLPHSMRLMVFNVVGIMLAVIAYAFGAGGTIAAMIYLFVLFNGVLDRWAQPMIEAIKR